MLFHLIGFCVPFSSPCVQYVFPAHDRMMQFSIHKNNRTQMLLLRSYHVKIEFRYFKASPRGFYVTNSVSRGNISDRSKRRSPSKVVPRVRGRIRQQSSVFLQTNVFCLKNNFFLNLFVRSIFVSKIVDQFVRNTLFLLSCGRQFFNIKYK